MRIAKIWQFPPSKPSFADDIAENFTQIIYKNPAQVSPDGWFAGDVVPF